MGRGSTVGAWAASAPDGCGRLWLALANINNQYLIINNSSNSNSNSNNTNNNHKNTY